MGWLMELHVSGVITAETPAENSMRTQTLGSTSIAFKSFRFPSSKKFNLLPMKHAHAKAAIYLQLGEFVSEVSDRHTPLPAAAAAGTTTAAAAATATTTTTTTAGVN